MVYTDVEFFNLSDFYVNLNQNITRQVQQTTCKDSN